MKRILAVLFAALLLAACQPTPEQDYVVNKGDNVVEEKLNATPKPDQTAEPAQTGTDEAQPTAQPVNQFFPTRWDDETTVSDRVRIAIHADVIQKEDGLYPVYRLKDAPLTEEMARELAAKLLDKPVEAYTSEATKADIEQEIQDYLDTVEEQQEWVAAGMPPREDRDETVFSQEEIDAQLAYLRERFNNAPDKLETKPVSDYSGLHLNTETTYTMESGEKAYISFYKRGFSVHKGCAFYSELYNEEQYKEDKAEGEKNAKLWHDVTMERADAEAILNSELERLGLKDYSVFSAYRACRCERSRSESMTYKSGGWAFTLRRNPGGYPTTEFPWRPSQYLKYGSGDGFDANQTVRDEHIVVFVDENGIETFSYYNRREIVGMPNANVELQPFSEIQRLAKNALTACMPYELFGEQNTEIEVYKVILTTYTLRVKDSDEYYAMPCWVLLFDGIWASDNREYRLRERDSIWHTHDALVLNAIDGSIVHTDYGY